MLGEEAAYFTDEQQLAALLLKHPDCTEHQRQVNLQKIRTLYSMNSIVEAYEQLMRRSVARNKQNTGHQP